LNSRFTCCSDRRKRASIDRTSSALATGLVRYQRIDFDAFDVAAPAVDDQLLAVNEALDKLALAHPVQAELVKLRYFAGLTNEEVSQVLGISLSTAKNYWAFARAWLLNEMDGN